ncbi:hypothetical protein F441_21112, partial [Phytophthora nicotianae CJ01A1]
SDVIHVLVRLYIVSRRRHCTVCSVLHACSSLGSGVSSHVASRRLPRASREHQQPTHKYSDTVKCHSGLADRYRSAHENRDFYARSVTTVLIASSSRKYVMEIVFGEESNRCPAVQPFGSAVEG